MALIDIYRVCEITKLSRSTIYNKVKSEDFPAPDKVPSPSSRGPRLVNRWEEDDVWTWAATPPKWLGRLTDEAVEQDTLKAPYGDDFLAETRTKQTASAHEVRFIDWYEKPQNLWKKYSPHLIAIATIVVVVSVVKYFML
jgi:predicted DNA-binding transcriptional regulator AlpA